MDFWRQLGIVAPHVLEVPVTVIGTGGIGSPTVFVLSKMGCTDITVWDDDTVENHNLPNQMYKVRDIGRSKVESLQGIVAEFTGSTLRTRLERVKSTSPMTQVVVSGVDSMAARQEIWSAVKYNPAVDCYIDARMGGEVGRVLTIRPTFPEEVEYYQTTLYSDEDALELPCTAQAIAYNVFVIAGLIANQVKKFLNGEQVCQDFTFDLRALGLLQLR